MALITEVDLPYLPIDDPGFQSDPFPYIDAARAQHPWLARIDVGYFVFGYEAVKLLAARDDWFHPDFQTVVDQLGLGGTPWADYQTNMLVGISGDRHRRIRMSTGAAFTPVNINRHLGLIREQPRTAHEIAGEIWGDVAVTQAYLTLSEVIGHVDLLVAEGLVEPRRERDVTVWHAL